MRFFFDNNVSLHLVNGMRAFGENVIHLQEKFPENTDDVIWLKHLGENKMVLITRDEKIRWNPAERDAFRKHKVGAFFLSGKNLDRCRMIQQVVKNWPRIKEYARKSKPPYFFRVPSRGTKFTALNF